MTPFQSRLLAAERRAVRLADGVARFGRGLAAVWQGLRDADTGAGAGGCLVTINFTITSFATGAGLPGVTVVYAPPDPVTGDYDPTQVAASGVTDASGKVTITTTSRFGDGYIFWAIHPRLGHFAAAAFAGDQYDCGSTVDVTYAALAAPGYRYVLHGYDWPLSRTLSVLDAFYGISVPMTDGVGTASVAYSGAGGCSARTVTVEYDFLGGTAVPIFTVSYQVAPTTISGHTVNCPNDGGSTPQVDGWPNGTPTASGDPATATGLTVTLAPSATTAAPIYGNTAGSMPTLTITEV